MKLSKKKEDNNAHSAFRLPTVTQPATPSGRSTLFQVQQISPEIGKGLIALKNIPSGTRLLRESPLIAAQLELNRKFVASCANCFRYLASNVRLDLDT